MSKDEILDIYDNTGQHIGLKNRKQVHLDGDWHRNFHCWIVFRDSTDTDWVILQKRSEKKGSWPSKFTVTVAGHYEAGETVENGVREIQEEVGVTVTFGDLISLGTRVCVDGFQPGRTNNEFQDVFLLIHSQPLKDYNLQGDELSGLAMMKVDDLIDLFDDSNEIDQICCDGFELRAVSDSIEQVSCNYNVSRKDFIPTLDRYVYKVMLIAKQVLKGNRRVAI